MSENKCQPAHTTARDGPVSVTLITHWR